MAGITCRRIQSVFLNVTNVIQTTNIRGKCQPQLATSSFADQKFYSSFQSSNPVRDLLEYPEVVIVKNPLEWKYVERLLKPPIVPIPVPKNKYPSGWKPPQPITGERQYFIARTKNHMLPVYLQVKFRGTRRLTIVRRVQGDIWRLEKDLRKIIENFQNGKICATRVNELSGQIHFHGDYVNLVKDWLFEKGY